MKIALIDNYDSFTFNIFHYLKNKKCEVEIFRNDKFKIKQIKNFDKIVISPGPGNPSNAGKCLKLINFEILFWLVLATFGTQLILLW